MVLAWSLDLSSEEDTGNGAGIEHQSSNWDQCWSFMRVNVDVEMSATRTTQSVLPFVSRVVAIREIHGAAAARDTRRRRTMALWHRQEGRSITVGSAKIYRHKAYISISLVLMPTPMPEAISSDEKSSSISASPSSHLDNARHTILAS